ncbi:hypothetical protein [Desulfoluna butyratoxydans]|uniref:DUF5666 domain-containing protein n=1 Tax=Desulfoluna butyratoxydans TaxID=231438 RepID=A0A4U8YSJ2_9BACT|nr:hypothetical protein [Desulfoluna butyratoxydans]VFQ46734.1 hypothetical protein MSL71_44040 [Desulfoluna butyratoxydans]
MKTNVSVFLCAVALGALMVCSAPLYVMADDGKTAAVSEMESGFELGSGKVITAEVVGIDYADRVLMLSGPDGDVVHYEVSEDARNFDQIDIGDRVRVEYYGSVALYLGDHGMKPATRSGSVTGRAAKGEKPAGILVETVDVSAEIVAIDRENRSVTLKLPDGNVITTRVDTSVETFDTLKVGLSIHARYTEAIAVSVEKS